MHWRRKSHSRLFLFMMHILRYGLKSQKFRSDTKLEIFFLFYSEFFLFKPVDCATQLEFHLAIIYSVFTMTNPRAPLAFESKPVAFLYYLLAYLSASGNNRNFKWSRFLVIMLLIMISDYHLERENMVLNFSHGFSPPGFRLPSVKVD